MCVFRKREWIREGETERKERWETAEKGDGGDAKAQEKKEKEERINIESRSYRKSDLLDEKLRINDRKRIYIR